MYSEATLRTQKVRELQHQANRMGIHVDEILEKLLTSSRAPNTIKAYDRAIKEFQEWQLQFSPNRTVDVPDLAAIFVAQKSLSCSSRSLATFVSALSYSRFGRKAHETQQWTVLDEMVQSKRRSEAVKEQNFASSAEWTLLLDTAAIMGWPQWRVDRAQILLTLLFCALLRVSEAVGLSTDDIKDRGQSWEIVIKHSKTDQMKNGAAIFLSKESWFDEILHRRIASVSPNQLLGTATGGHWTEGAAAAEIRRICDKAGIRRLSPHSFRRGGTMKALEDGVAPEHVQRRGRWASSRSMKPYVARTQTTQGGPADLRG